MPKYVYLCCSFALPFRVCLPNEIQIFVIQGSFLLLTMAFSPALSLLSRTFLIVWFFVFVVDDESLADLWEVWLDSLIDL